MSHQTFNKKSYGFLLYIIQFLLCFSIYVGRYACSSQTIHQMVNIHEILMDMYATNHTLDISQEPDIQYTSTPYLDQ